MRRLVTALLVTMLCISCSTRSAEQVVQPNPDLPARAEALSPAFIAYVFPLTGEEFSYGQRSYDSPFIRQIVLSMADCVETSGYDELAAGLRLWSPPEVLEAWQFPNLPRLAVRGLYREPGAPAMTILEDAAVGGSEFSTSHPLYGTVQQFPEFGVPASVEEIERLATAISACWGQVESPLDSPFLDSVRSSWRVTLHQLDDEPSIASAIEEMMPCLWAIDGRMRDTQSPEEWFAAQLGIEISLAYDPDVPRDELDSQLVAWGQAYGDCVAPVEAARTPLRADERDRLVDEQLPQLLELQAELDAHLGS